MTGSQKIQSLAVIGDKEDVLPYIAIGGDVYITTDIAEARKALVSFVENENPVILVSDELMSQMDDLIEKYSSSFSFVIMAIPGRSGRSSFSEEKLRQRIKKAIGIDLEGIIEK
jgi:V/A-type H+-transporting ATPase subunit F